MVDLKVTYKDEYGQDVIKEYDTIMDFLDEIEAGGSKLYREEEVEATFFENKNRVEKFRTIESLYNHCNKIVH